MGARSKIAQEAHYLLAGVGHFLSQGAVCIVFESEQLSLFVAQLQDAIDNLAVIPLSCMGSLIGCTGRERPVELVAQLAIVRIGHYRQVRGKFQG